MENERMGKREERKGKENRDNKKTRKIEWREKMKGNEKKWEMEEEVERGGKAGSEILRESNESWYPIKYPQKIKWDFLPLLAAKIASSSSS